MTNALFELIEQYDIITIYRHVSPDSDALGSQFGLKQWIQDTYPNKQVYALGNNRSSVDDKVYPAMDEVSDDVVKNSLAIILDTANSQRIDDQRYKLARYRLKIDHHIYVETYADVEVIDEHMGATCEILTTMFMEREVTLSIACAQYLYMGLITDTLRFTISATTSNTLRCAAYLVDCGADVVKANEANFFTSMRQYKFENYLRSHCVVKEDCLAYIIVNKEDYEAFGLTFEEAKEKVFVMGGVFEFQIWALFVEKEKDAEGNRIYNASLRSQQKPINDIANAFHGGGHRLACGVKGLTKETIEQLLTALLARIKGIQ